MKRSLNFKLVQALGSLMIPLGLSGCATLDSLNPFSGPSTDAPVTPAATSSSAKEVPAPKAEASEPAVKAEGGQEAAPEKALEELELSWKASEEIVTAYHINYGKTPERLEHHLRIPVSELEKVSQPDGSKAYRLKLRLPSLSDVSYVAIQAENASGLSPMTQPMKIQ